MSPLRRLAGGCAPCDPLNRNGRQSRAFAPLRIPQPASIGLAHLPLDLPGGADVRRAQRRCPLVLPLQVPGDSKRPSRVSKGDSPPDGADTRGFSDAGQTVAREWLEAEAA